MPFTTEQENKLDLGKPKMNLIDPEFELALAKVLTFGAKKYSDHQWRKGIKVSRIIAALKRHINAIELGADYDEETGLHHAAHAGCEVMFLYWMLLHKPGLDDRPNGWGFFDGVNE